MRLATFGEICFISNLIFKLSSLDNTPIFFQRSKVEVNWTWKVSMRVYDRTPRDPKTPRNKWFMGRNFTSCSRLSTVGPKHVKYWHFEMNKRNIFVWGKIAGFIVILFQKIFNFCQKLFSQSHSSYYVLSSNLQRLK